MHDYPTDELRREHELVLMVVEAIDREATAISRFGMVNRVRVAQMMDFVRNFVIGYHDLKEEEVLFPAVCERSAAAARPVGALLSEHLSCRDAVRAIDAALTDVDVDPGEIRVVTEQLDLLSALLRHHIAKEDVALFPLADVVLSDQEQELLAGEFRRIEDLRTAPGERERYHALARQLARIAPDEMEDAELAA